MNIKEALNIIKEFQKYRRGEKPYDGETLGEALDSIIKFVDVTISAQEMFALIGAELNFCGVINEKNSKAKAGK